MLGLKLIHINKKGALDRFLIMDLALRQNAYLLSYDQAAFSKDVYRSKREILIRMWTSTPQWAFSVPFLRILLSLSRGSGIKIHVDNKLAEMYKLETWPG